MPIPIWRLFNNLSSKICANKLDHEVRRSTAARVIKGCGWNKIAMQKVSMCKKCVCERERETVTHMQGKRSLLWRSKKQAEERKERKKDPGSEFKFDFE